MSNALAPHIDTHAHVFEPGLATVAQPRYVPSYAAPLAAYLEQLDVNGMQRGVLVQPSFLGSDNSYLLAALAQAPDRLRGVIVVDTAHLESELSEERMARLDASGVRGMRLNLVGAAVPALQSAEWQIVGERLAALGWHLEIQAAGAQWEALESALTAWPSTVVIDHLGLPSPDERDAKRRVLRLASRINTWVKVSGFYRSQPGEALSMTSALRSAGLTERLVFGSDWPFTRFEDQRYADLKYRAVEALGDDAERVLGQNALRLMGWGFG